MILNAAESTPDLLSDVSPVMTQTAGRLSVGAAGLNLFKPIAPPPSVLTAADGNVVLSNPIAGSPLAAAAAPAPGYGASSVTFAGGVEPAPIYTYAGGAAPVGTSSPVGVAAPVAPAPAAVPWSTGKKVAVGAGGLGALGVVALLVKSLL